METMYRILLALHIAAGTVALVTFWVAAFARKGSRLHVGAGIVYWRSMVSIIATALPMAGVFFLRGGPGIGTFLLYLVVITAVAMWSGRRAIRLKKDQAAYRSGAYGAVALASLLAGLVVLATGLTLRNTLLIGFSFVGTVVGISMLRKRGAISPVGNWWMQEHYSAMLGCGVATHVAFLSIGLDRLVEATGLKVPANFNLVAWALPLLVALVAGVVLDRKYLRRPAPDAARASVT
jgi:hypothetical protein